jgi:hypothetical protein
MQLKEGILLILLGGGYVGPLHKRIGFPKDLGAELLNPTNMCKDPCKSMEIFLC